MTTYQSGDLAIFDSGFEDDRFCAEVTVLGYMGRHAHIRIRSILVAATAGSYQHTRVDDPIVVDSNALSDVHLYGEITTRLHTITGQTWMDVSGLRTPGQVTLTLSRLGKKTSLVLRDDHAVNPALIMERLLDILPINILERQRLTAVLIATLSRAHLIPSSFVP